MADPKQEETFKVIDRRHFTEAGEVRPEAADLDRREEEAAAKRAASQPKPEPAAAAPAPAAKAPMPASAGPTLVTAPPTEELEADASDADSGEPMTASSRSFQMLIDFLTRNAAAMLGGMADPRTGQPFVDLEGARDMIDMLDALREKTMGNLSKDDEQLLVEILGSLKLSYMEVSKVAAEAMAKKGKIGSIKP